MLATEETLEKSTHNTSDTYKSMLNESKPETFSVFNSKSSDIITLNHLAYTDPMHTQLHETKSVSITEKQIEASYKLFNKNFSSFMKYTDSNLDINMVVSDSPSLNKKTKESDSEEAKILVKELAATSLTKTPSTCQDNNGQLSSKASDSVFF